MASRVPRIGLVLLVAALLTLSMQSAAQAKPMPRRTLTVQVAVPKAGDYSVASFELSIGGEGRRHRKQPVRLQLINYAEPGVFALARLRPELNHPGRFLGVLEVFHRANATTSPRAGGLASRPRAAAHVSGVLVPRDDFIVMASGARTIKERIKNNIVSLANAHMLGSFDFCDPLSKRTYLLGNAIIGAAYLLAGPLTGLPPGTSPGQLADDAVSELCDEVEDYDEDDYFSDDEGEYSGIAVFLTYLANGLAPPPMSYHVGLRGGNWIGAGPGELMGSNWALTGHVGGRAHIADSTNPIDAIKIVLPAAGSTPRRVTDYICPTQLPTAAIVTTTTAADTLKCSGGSLPIGQSFSVNVRMAPDPSAGMGGMLVVHQDGADLAPFTLTGP